MRTFTDSPFERMMMQVPRITDTEPKPPADAVRKKRGTRNKMRRDREKQK